MRFLLAKCCFLAPSVQVQATAAFFSPLKAQNLLVKGSRIKNVYHYTQCLCVWRDPNVPTLQFPSIFLIKLNTAIDTLSSLIKGGKQPHKRIPPNKFQLQAKLPTSLQLLPNSRHRLKSVSSLHQQTKGNYVVPSALRSQIALIFIILISQIIPSFLLAVKARNYPGMDKPECWALN